MYCVCSKFMTRNNKRKSSKQMQNANTEYCIETSYAPCHLCATQRTAYQDDWYELLEYLAVLEPYSTKVKSKIEHAIVELQRSNYVNTNTRFITTQSTDEYLLNLADPFR